MDRPTDLTGCTPEEPDDGSDAVVRAFRAALGDGGPTSSVPRTTTAGAAAGRERPAAPAPLLAAVERRAARLHRRRRAAALGGAAAAAAVAVLLGGLVLPQLDLSVTQGASNGSAAGGSGGDAGGGGGGGGAAPEAAGAPSAAQEDRAAAAAVPALGEASLLTAEDLDGAFAAPVQPAAAAPEPDTELALGACVDGDAGAVPVEQLWRVDLLAAPSAAAPEPPGVVERVAVVPGPAAASAALAQVRQALPGCSEPGLEGTGPTSEVDAAAVAPDGGQALVLASTSGQGSPTLRVLVAVGSVLVQVDATSDAGDAQEAYDALVPAVRTAVQRATGGGASFSAPVPPTTLPSAGAP
ncbi:hypothetical protein [Quadrisphaera sp. KR29]|uniref:hypothetical protein n=1 Tax=Quadrisphaera sp. KR29 TaxID=3461391 RepID=UPI004044469D